MKSSKRLPCFSLDLQWFLLLEIGGRRALNWMLVIPVQVLHMDERQLSFFLEILVGEGVNFVWWTLQIGQYRWMNENHAIQQQLLHNEVGISLY